MNYLFLYLKKDPGKGDKSMALYSVADFFALSIDIVIEVSQFFTTR